MSRRQTDSPFEDIECSLEYVSLLADAVEETSAEIDADLANATAPGGERRREALQLVRFKLSKLSSHLTASRRVLNDLRSLRRLLLSERGAGTEIRK